MWTGQCEVDAHSEALLITARIGSKEEFVTDEIKPQISGLNAARLFSIDPEARRQAVQADKLRQLREHFRQHPQPSNAQYGWVWIDDGREPTTPVGTG